jgi:hypothetical protein
MFEHVIGLSRQDFLKRRVFPASPTDKYNDNKCCFCWGPYNDTNHPGARFLPCNHVIGRDCLKIMVNSQGGDLCPICRTRLFYSPINAIQRSTRYHSILSWTFSTVRFVALFCLCRLAFSVVKKCIGRWGNAPTPIV